MKKKIKLISIVCAIILLFTGTFIVLANQENELEVPHNHEYQITAFDKSTGIVTFSCEICGEEKKDRFADHIDERGYEPIDMNHDGIINGKDFAYLMRNYDNK